MTIGTQAYLQGYMHEKTAVEWRGAGGLPPTNVDSKYLMQITPEGEKLMREEAQQGPSYNRHLPGFGKQQPAPKRKSILDRVKGFLKGEEQWKGSANSQYFAGKERQMTPAQRRLYKHSQKIRDSRSRRRVARRNAAR
jgi:hypothetical protein